MLYKTLQSILEYYISIESMLYPALIISRVNACSEFRTKNISSGAPQVKIFLSMATFNATWSSAKVNDYTCKNSLVEIEVPTSFVSSLIKDVKSLGQFSTSSN